jgi:putative membrane protein
MVRILCAVLALAVCVSLAPAQEDNKAVQRKDFDKEKPLDKEFLVAMHSCCNAMDRIIGLVERRASSNEVKEFAKKIKEDHDKLSKKLGETIKDKKIAAVAGLDKDVNDKIAALGKLEKGEFDKEFLKQVVEGHEKAIKKAENQKTNGKDKDITNFAEDLLTTLKDHLKKAKELQKKVE